MSIWDFFRKPAPPAFHPDDLLGMWREEAEAACLAAGYAFRTTHENGESFGLTADRNAKRVNAELWVGKVTRVWVG